MANNLYNLFGGQPQRPSDGGFAQMAEKLQGFADNYRGDPYAEAQQMIRSGRITQAQWEQALNMARKIVPHLHR